MTKSDYVSQAQYALRKARLANGVLNDSCPATPAPSSERQDVAVFLREAADYRRLAAEAASLGF